MDNILKIKHLIQRGESESVEFKESFCKEAIETVCAFANSRGGTLFLGVDDHGYVTGVQLGESTLREWQNQISQGTGGLTPSIEKLNINGKTIAAIHVSASRIKPVMYSGRAYKRSGSTTRQPLSQCLQEQVPPKYPPSTPQVPPKYQLLKFCIKPQTVKNMLHFMKLKDRKNFKTNFLYPLLKEGLLVMTDPSSPRSPKQRYIATKKGTGQAALLEKRGNDFVKRGNKRGNN